MSPIADPIHPGEILENEFLEPLGVSATSLAKAIGVPRARVERLLKGATDVTPVTAHRLSGALGTTSEFWLAMQASFDKAVAGGHRSPHSIAHCFNPARSR